ncbi:hypothetical protein ACCY16_19590 [Candidatus Pantoea formicae]|uniref:hypothetical protein n=1 Tax=Candidatus Pantoea formicae TaxID=2608355 RepID=UPI003EDB3BC4
MVNNPDNGTLATQNSIDSAVSNSLTVFDASGNPLSFSKVVLELADNRGGEALIQVRDIAALRATEPTRAGELASVLEYTAGTAMGGGLFVYDKSDNTTKEDFGITFVTAKGARWKRVLFDYNSVTVLDFGAVADGKTDCVEAVKRMFDWSQANYPATGIRFTAGKFLLSQFDIASKEVNRFKLSGAPVNFGYFPTTTLVSDRKDNQVMFNVNARYVEISGFVIDGESSATGSSTNSKGFFKNIIQAGQFLRVSSIEFRNLGGRGLDILDTLDCKIDQWYARDCQNSLIHAYWSDNPNGKWDHSTAIELSNFNIQRNKARPAIYAPRCTQAMIRNGWIEHSSDPGDISNGQWILEALSIEGCDTPLKMAYCRTITLQKNIQGGNGFDFTPRPGDIEWLSEYERGSVEIDNTGIIINGALNYDYVTAQHQMNNLQDAHSWWCVGEVQLKLGQQVHMRVIGTAAYNSMGSTQLDATDRTSEGVAHIYLQSLKSQIACTWSGEGSCPVSQVQVEQIRSGECRIYVKLSSYTASAKVLLETNGESRMEAGTHFLYRKIFTKCDTAKSSELDEAVKTPSVFEQHWTGNARVGYGYNHNGELLLHASKGTLSEFSDITELLKVRINGAEYALEVRKKK